MESSNRKHITTDELICGIIMSAIIGFVVGACTLHYSIMADASKRGVARYNERTATWEWTCHAEEK